MVTPIKENLPRRRLGSLGKYHQERRTLNHSLSNCEEDGIGNSGRQTVRGGNILQIIVQALLCQSGRPILKFRHSEIARSYRRPIAREVRLAIFHARRFSTAVEPRFDAFAVAPRKKSLPSPTVFRPDSFAQLNIVDLYRLPACDSQVLSNERTVTIRQGFAWTVRSFPGAKLRNRIFTVC